MQNVFYISQFNVNLLPMGALLHNSNISLIVHDSFFVIKDKHSLQMSKGELQGVLYVLKVLHHLLQMELFIVQMNFFYSWCIQFYK